LSVKEGLPYDYALNAITIIPAEIIGVGDRVGSLEVGKDADLRLLSGDPLDIMTKCQKVIINGEVVHSL
jgi:imidazolonepropionase-like amidohydrolase